MSSKNIRACKECHEEIKVMHAGDESWDYCEGCNQIEGETVYLDENDKEVEV